jgi:site-specific recombinase XerD
MTEVGLGSKDLLPALGQYRRYLRTVDRLRYTNGSLHHSVVAATALIRFLREQGILPAEPTGPSAPERHPILIDFREWMVRHRGVAPTTLEQYQRTVVELLDRLGGEPRTWTAPVLRRFVLDRASGHSATLAQCISTAIRAFLRFVSATGCGPVGMESAIPEFANWRLAATPRFIEPEELERVIASCDPENGTGLRDRAVILLLARLGLRAGDVANVSFDDIDWRSGRLSVSGKSRRQEWLPLPQEVGDALLAYISTARPRLAMDRVFTTVKAPLRPLSRAAVTHVVRSALRRAGIDAPTCGAHLLRHSAATAMLRRGASLAGIGAVLRHRSPSTTAHYAKVDFALLREIAQPWPEVSPC